MSTQLQAGTIPTVNLAYRGSIIAPSDSVGSVLGTDEHVRVVVLHDIPFEIYRAAQAPASSHAFEREIVGSLRFQLLNLNAAFKPAATDVDIAGASASDSAAVTVHPEIPAALALLLNPVNGTLLTANAAWPASSLVNAVSILWVKVFNVDARKLAADADAVKTSLFSDIWARLNSLPAGYVRDEAQAAKIILFDAPAADAGWLRFVGFRRVSNSSIFGLAKDPAHPSRAVRREHDAPFRTQPIPVPSARSVR